MTQLTQRFQCGDIVEVVYGNGSDRHLEGTTGILKGKLGHGKSKVQLEILGKRNRKEGFTVVDTCNIKLIKSVTQVKEEKKLEEDYSDEG